MRNAERLGHSRVEYIRRRLASDAAASNVQVSAQDLRKSGERFADLADAEVMDAPSR